MEIYSNKILLQKTDISNKQTKLTPQKLKREEQQEVSRRKGIKKKKKKKSRAEIKMKKTIAKINESKRFFFEKIKKK